MDVDRILLSAGDWNWDPPVGATQSIPAPCLFHAGYTDLEQDALVLDAAAHIGLTLLRLKVTRLE